MIPANLDAMQHDLILAQLRHTNQLADPATWSDDGLEYFRGAAELLASMIGAYENGALIPLLEYWGSMAASDDLELFEAAPSDSPCPELLTAVGA